MKHTSISVITEAAGISTRGQRQEATTDEARDTHSALLRLPDNI